MSITNATETAILALFFNATTFNDIAENDTTTPNTVFWLSLATGDPGETGTQTTSEAAYTSYGRLTINRASGAGGFTVSGNSATLTDALNSFPAATGGSETETHFGFGKSQTTAGTLYGSGTVTPNIAVATGVTPQLTSATAITMD